jgi:hypothetical protein
MSSLIIFSSNLRMISITYKVLVALRELKVESPYYFLEDNDSNLNRTIGTVLREKELKS